MFLIPPLKAKKHEIISNKSPLEVYKILKTITKPAATSFDTCDFIGEIGFPNFQIRPHFPFIKTSTSPLLHGKILKSNGKSKIIIEARSFIFFPVLLCYVFSLILLVMGTGMLISNDTVSINEPFFAAAISAVVGLILSLFCYYIPMSTSIKKIKNATK